MAFQEPGAEVQPEQSSAVLALGESDELMLFGLVKHAVKGGGSGSQPLLAQLLALVGGQGSRSSHGSLALD
jgi:hypothetical protein